MRWNIIGEYDFEGGLLILSTTEVYGYNKI